MQKNIAFYISDQTMEHALRTVPILQNMLKLDDELHIFVKSGPEQVRFMESYLHLDERLCFHPMVMKERNLDCWDDLADVEISFLQEKQIGLVVSDICPWIFPAADELRIKSILIGNYTWAELCESEEEREEYLSCYELASRMFVYDLHVPELTGYGVEYELISMMNRPYNMDEIEAMPGKAGREIVFMDLPGREMVNVADMPYYFIVTEGTALEGGNVSVISRESKEIHNYIAASSYVIAYGTWNRIAEAVLANRKAAFVIKEDVPMSGWMIDRLVQREQCLRAEKTDLADLDALLRKLADFRYSYDHEYYNSDYDLAKKILFSYPEKRRRTRS